MAGEKKFRSGLFGFNKVDVNAYIERILSEFEGRLKDKDDEISNLKLQIREMKNKCDLLASEAASAAKEKDMIARALIQAEEKAVSVVEAARAEALAEKDKLEKLLEGERERIIDVKRDVKSMKGQVADMLAKFQVQLEEAENAAEAREARYSVGEGEDQSYGQAQ